MGDEEYRPLYVVNVYGRTMILNSWNAVESLVNGVPRAYQERIDNKKNRKQHLETVKKYGTSSQYEYFKSLVDREESGGSTGIFGDKLIDEKESRKSKGLFESGLE